MALSHAYRQAGAWLSMMNKIVVISVIVALLGFGIHPAYGRVGFISR